MAIVKRDTKEINRLENNADRNRDITVQHTNEVPSKCFKKYIHNAMSLCYYGGI